MIILNEVSQTQKNKFSFSYTNDSFGSSVMCVELHYLLKSENLYETMVGRLQ